jgi:hypothetical protein
MRRITAALRGALYGAPLAAATTQADAFKQELVAAALLGAAGDVAEVLSLELEAVHQQQPGGSEPWAFGKTCEHGPVQIGYDKVYVEGLWLCGSMLKLASQ